MSLSAGPVSAGEAAPALPAVAISVQADRPGAAPMKVGVFFEDINYGADGGLYPERVKNRSFEFTEPLMGWKPLGGDGVQGTATVVSETAAE